MMEQLIPYLIFLAALGSGLIAGLFFAFSTFVMNALARLPWEQGISAMQAINITVINRVFLAVFMGTTFVSILLVFISLFNWENPNSIYILVGSVLYFFGSFLVTALRNVPLNNMLANANGKDKESEALWKNYLDKWTAWNHIRTIASLAALASFILAL